MPIKLVGNSPDTSLTQARSQPKSESTLGRPISLRTTRPQHTGLPDRLKSGIESLSGFSLDNVKVHYDSAKPAQLNARAFAQGADIHIAPGQEKHLPHEAWHVVQQAQGRVQPTLQAKAMAINDDSNLEQEAEIMGEKASQQPIAEPVTRGASRPEHSSLVPIAALQASLLRPRARAGTIIQGYFEQNYHQKGTWLQADDLSVVVEKGYPNHKLFAKPGKAASANQALKAVTSGIELLETSKSDIFRDGSKRVPNRRVTLKKIEVKNTQNNTQGGKMKLYADCGKSNAVVVGSSDRSAIYRNPKGSTGKASGEPAAMKSAIMKAWLNSDRTGKPSIRSSKQAGDKKELDLPAIVAEWSAAKTDKEKSEIATRYEAKLDEIADAYWSHYNGLKQDDRDKIDKDLQINRYANPGVGQGFTISSGGPSAGKATWNYHWGGVVMTSDDNKDKVVLENYAVGDPKVENTKWTFDLYGTEKKDQSFHERHQATLQHGINPTTMAIEKD